jgi:membrane-bound ClpP family serine protease
MTLALLLLAAGLALVVAEVLFPSFGILTILSIACFVGSLVAAFGEGTSTGFTFVGATAVLVPIALLGGLKLFPRTPIGKRFVMDGLSHESAAATDDRDLVLVGHEGVVEAECRPAGIARIDGRRVDVVSRGRALEVGTPIRVAEVSGNRVVVVAAADVAG